MDTSRRITLVFCAALACAIFAGCEEPPENSVMCEGYSYDLSNETVAAADCINEGAIYFIGKESVELFQPNCEADFPANISIEAATGLEKGYNYLYCWQD
jgi:hypothetical protein